MISCLKFQLIKDSYLPNVLAEHCFLILGKRGMIRVFCLCYMLILAGRVYNGIESLAFLNYSLLVVVVFSRIISSHPSMRIAASYPFIINKIRNPFDPLLLNHRILVHYIFVWLSPTDPSLANRLVVFA